MGRYDMHCAFDAEKHKAEYIHYLEVIIDSDGTVVYAVPSHQEKALALAMEKFNAGRQEIIDSCPPTMYGDYLTWLLSLTGSIAVWYTGYIGEPNRKQALKLKALKLQGIYGGRLPAANRKKGEEYENTASA